MMVYLAHRHGGKRLKNVTIESLVEEGTSCGAMHEQESCKALKELHTNPILDRSKDLTVVITTEEGRLCKPVPDTL